MPDRSPVTTVAAAGAGLAFALSALMAVGAAYASRGLGYYCNQSLEASDGMYSADSRLTGQFALPR